MPPPGLDRIKAIFVEAMEKNGLERQAFVHKACGNDAELLAEVEAFLAASEKAGDFLTGSTVGGSQEKLREGPGTIIGPYKLLQLIGEGGFGCVFLAEQERPVRRQVALKIIKLGMDTKQVIARFEAERQALAMMDHPNIARVYEAGATETGRPYFVMEMIRGIPITEFCDNERLTTRQRAELFIQVCNAIQHAHQKGVIHRDVKPSNVLVTMHDDRAIPKVIDFGIAKAITGRLTERTLFTEFRQFLGTPAYMSPEQAEFNEVDVDTRSDVYSLGVLLYELLTSGTPFDATELRVAAYEEIRRIILEVEPPKPSTRISGLGATLSSVAQRRRVEPEKLLHSIQGDLDWIVMKCLEKNRSRRYETANALAMDVQRHLKNEPIVARPWSAAYRFRKIVGRNRLAFAVAGALLSILILGICVSTWQAVRASRARNDAQAAEREETHLRSDAEAALAEAQAQRDEAVKQRQIAAAVNNFLGDMLSKADPRAAGQDTTVMQAIDSAVKLLDAGAMKDQPLVEASLRVTIAKAQSDLASTVAAKQNLSRSIELYRQVWPADRIGLARALFELGRIENAGRDFGETEPILREALRIVTTTPGASEKDLADCLSSLATSLSGLDRNFEAEPMTRKSLVMFRDLGNDSDLAWGLVQSAWVLQNEGKFAEAEQMNREAVKLGQRSLSPNSTTLKWIVMHLAQILSQEGKYTESETYFREELAITQRAYPPGDLKIAGALQDLGNMFVAAGKLAEAEKIMRRALAIAEAHRPKSDADIGGALLSLGYTLVEEKKYGEAEPYLLQSVPLLEAQKMPRQQLYAVNALTNLGDIYSRQGEYSKAESFYRQALAVSEQNDPGGKLKIVYAFQNLGSLLAAEGKVGEAEQNMKQALTTVLAFFPNNDEEIGAAQMNLGYAQMMHKKYPEAEASFRLALQSTQKVKTARCLKNTSYSLTSLGDDLRMEQKYSDSESVLQQAMDFDQNLYLPESWEIAQDLIDLGVTLDDEKKFSDAEAIDRKAMEMFQRVNPADSLDIANAQENLGDVLCEQKKYGEAEPLLRNALKAFQKKGGDAMKPGMQDVAKYLAIVLDNTHRSSEAAELRRQFAMSRPSTQP